MKKSLISILLLFSACAQTQVAHNSRNVGQEINQNNNGKCNVNNTGDNNSFYCNVQEESSPKIKPEDVQFGFTLDDQFGSFNPPAYRIITVIANASNTPLSNYTLEISIPTCNAYGLSSGANSWRAGDTFQTSTDQPWSSVFGTFSGAEYILNPRTQPITLPAFQVSCMKIEEVTKVRVWISSEHVNHGWVYPITKIFLRPH